MNLMPREFAHILSEPGDAPSNRLFSGEAFGDSFLVEPGIFDNLVEVFSVSLSLAEE